MDATALIDQCLSAWRTNSAITLHLLEHMADAGLAAVPTGSRGRSVAGQLEHMARVQTGWVGYHRTGERPQMGGADKKNPPAREALTELLTDSAEQVEAFLGKALRGEAKVRMFSGSPIRFMSYLIAHDSHHRGSILLALKQNGMRMDEDVALTGVWGAWFNEPKHSA